MRLKCTTTLTNSKLEMIVKKMANKQPLGMYERLSCSIVLLKTEEKEWLVFMAAENNLAQQMVARIEKRKDNAMKTGLYFKKDVIF